MIALLTVVCVISMVACGSTDVSTESTEKSQDPVKTQHNTATAPTEEPVVTAEPVEATPAPTEEPTAEATPEPTKEPVVYEGIDMESDLPGLEWIATLLSFSHLTIQSSQPAVYTSNPY